MLERILDFIWVYGVGILRMFFFMFLLTGCVGYAASPLTVPVWIAYGVALPDTWGVWRGFTVLHLITFSFVAWSSFIEHNWSTFSSATILAVLTLVLCFAAPGGRIAVLSRKWAVVGVQILVAVMGLATIFAYMLSPHGYSGT